MTGALTVSITTEDGVVSLSEDGGTTWTPAATPPPAYRSVRRTIRPERANEPRDPIRVRRLARRKHPAEDDRQIALLHLSPLPRDALPESPVVVVIPGSSVERDPLAVNIELAVQET